MNISENIVYKLVLQKLSEKIDDIIPYMKVAVYILYHKAEMDTMLCVDNKDISNAFFCISEMLNKCCNELGTASETASGIARYMLNPEIQTDKYKERCDKNDGSQA